MNRSEISNEFNFDNQLDITQNRRDKDPYFSKQGFAFEDFMNIGDRTNKSIDKLSSKHYNNTSEIFKKDQDSGINPNNIIDYLTEHSIKNRKKEPSLLENLSQTNPPQILNATSPKFAEEILMQTAKSIQEPSKKQFTLRRADTTGVDRAPAQEKMIQASTKTIENPFKKKSIAMTANRQKQEQYKQLQNQIHFYDDALERMIYESQRMQEQTENLMSAFNSAAHEVQLEVYAKEIKTINEKIEEERNLEVQLTRMVAQLDEEYQQLVNSIKSSNFARPVRMKDEAKAIVDEINSLKAQFEALERDDGSLNLSSTLLPSALQVGNTFRGQSKKDSSVGVSKIQEIYAENKRSQDPRFLQNIKMACLRDEWNLYSNSQIQINLNYRNCPKIKLTIGNKLNKDLQKFTFKEDSNPKLDGETVSAKSYIIHEIEIKEDCIDQLFIKCELSYTIDNTKRTVCFFVPTGVTTFGEFSPITQKQFINDAGQEEFQFCSGYRPLDKKLVSNITQIEYYMPNLLIDRQNFKCCGLFISLFNSFTFLQIRQKGELVSISAKTSEWPLIRLLQFIITL